MAARNAAEARYRLGNRIAFTIVARRGLSSRPAKIGSERM
jgi:hypothetical protein